LPPGQAQAPTLPHIRPLSLQDGDTRIPDSIVKHHQDG
jgi:hypothetical protein